MSAVAPMRHLGVLAIGFAASMAVALEVVGPYQGWTGQQPVDRFLSMFLLPLTATAIVLLLRSLQRRRPPAGENGQADAALQSIVFWILVFLIGVHLLMMSVLTGVELVMPWAQRGVIVLLGIALVAIGNLLPRTRPNLALGIRTSRTLTDRNLWILTHRVSGYIVVGIGVVTIVSGAVVTGTSVAAAPFIAMLVGATVVGAYYWKAAGV